MDFGTLLLMFRKRIWGAVKGAWQYIFDNQRILIFGDAGSGKTALGYYLTTGAPYLIENGEKKLPQKTFEPEAVGISTKLSKEVEKRWATVPMDVGGEKLARKYWKTMIEDIKPQGIIYMVNGDVSDVKFQIAIEDLFNDLLIHCKKDTDHFKALKVLHVFINHCDKWAINPKSKNDKIGAVNQFIVNVTSEPEWEHLQAINFQTSITQLSPLKSQWQEVKQALHNFGGALSV